MSDLSADGKARKIFHLLRRAFLHPTKDTPKIFTLKGLENVLGFSLTGAGSEPVRQKLAANPKVQYDETKETLMFLPKHHATIYDFYSLTVQIHATATNGFVVDNDVLEVYPDVDKDITCMIAGEMPDDIRVRAVRNMATDKAIRCQKGKDQKCALDEPRCSACASNYDVIIFPYASNEIECSQRVPPELQALWDSSEVKHVTEIDGHLEIEDELLKYSQRQMEEELAKKQAEERLKLTMKSKKKQVRTRKIMNTHMLDESVCKKAKKY